TGGNQLTSGDQANGWFMEATVLTNVKPTHRIACEEVFGPVIAVLAAADFNEALQLANGVDVGLSASIVTRDLKKAMTYAEKIQAGVVKVNQISTGLALQAPFGALGKSRVPAADRTPGSLGRGRDVSAQQNRAHGRIQTERLPVRQSLRSAAP